MAKTLCDRCKKETLTLRMSRFNTEMCCEGCLTAERKLPEYAEAERAEREAVLRGDYNFPGIGYPAHRRTQN